MSEIENNKGSKAIAKTNGNSAAGGNAMSKYQRSIAMAKGDKIEGAQVYGDASQMVSKWTPEQMTEMAVSGDFEFAPQLHTLAEGDKVEGILEGRGPGADFEDDEGQEKHVDSWIIRHGSVRLSILSSTQLDRKLPPFIGVYVMIARGPDMKTGNGGRKVTNYFVCGQKLANGQERSFAIPEQKVLVAGDAAPAEAISVSSTATTVPNHTPTHVS